MILSVVLHFYCGNLLLFDVRGFWVLCLFSYKGNFRMIGDDLVNSYHLLLCCLDLIFANAIICPNRGDLLNPSFKGKTLFIFQNWLSVFRKRVLKIDHILSPLLLFIPCHTRIAIWFSYCWLQGSWRASLHHCCTVWTAWWTYSGSKRNKGALL